MFTQHYRNDTEKYKQNLILLTNMNTKCKSTPKKKNNYLEKF